MKPFWAWLLVVLCWTEVAVGQDVQPSAPSSHEKFLEELSASRNRTRQEIIGRYDAYLTSHSSDARTAVERCAFIQQSVDEDGDDDDSAPDAKLCSDDLETQYGRHPSVVSFRLRSMWGDEAVQYGERKLADSDIPFTPAERASALGVMADRRHAQHRLEEASRLGAKAEQIDSTYDASYVIADHLRSRGQRQPALDVLRRRLADDRKPSSLLTKAHLLFDLDDPEHALTAIRSAKQQKETYIDPVFEGRVLEAVGDTDGARAAFAKQTKWNQQEVMTRLFYLDLAKGNASAATAAYRTLRDLGWKADPVGRHRLALALVHPATPWELRDLGGVFGIFLAIITAALLPAGVAIPVHYVGLVRRVRGASEESTRWKLRDAWIAGSLLILGSFIALYLFAYEDFATLLGSRVKANLSQQQLARVGIASFLSTGLTAALFARRDDWKRLAPAAWLTRTTLRTAGKFFALLIIAAWINRWLASFFLPAPTAASSEGLALSTLECLRAIGHVYGTLTLVIVAAGAVPLGEEFLFRGVLLDGLQRHISFRWANAIQAVLFALAHENLRMAPFLFTMGVLAGYLRRKTGSLTTGVVVHALNNLVASLAIAAGVTPG